MRQHVIKFTKKLFDSSTQTFLEEGASIERAWRGLRQFVTIARATAAEGLHQPETFFLTFSGVVLTATVPLFHVFRFGEPGRLAREGGLAFMLVFGLVLSVCLAGASLRRELSRGTAAAALSRCLPRAVFLCAKWAGVLGVLLVFWLCLLATTLMAERMGERFVFAPHAVGYFPDRRLAVALLAVPPLALAVAARVHHRWQRRFGGTALGALQGLLALLLLGSGFFARTGEWHAPGDYHLDMNPHVAGVALLILLALAVFAALAAALATRLNTPVVLMLCSLVLFTGLLADRLAAAMPSAAWAVIPDVLIPNLQHFWMCDVLADRGSIPGAFIARVALYALTWCLLALGIGTRSLQNLDIG